MKIDKFAYAFVDYETHANAEKAFIDLNGSIIGGERIRIEWAKKSKTHRENNKNYYTSNRR